MTPDFNLFMGVPKTPGLHKCLNGENVPHPSFESWPKRLYGLDVSRGFAALSVVLWHWQHFAYKENHLPQGFVRSSQPLYQVLKLFYEKGESGVQYFFLLSGFIFFWIYQESIKKKEINVCTFAVQRFSRLYPLHLITLLFVAGFQALYILRENFSFVYPNNDLFHFVLNLAFASNWGFESGWSFNAPVWSVSIEVLLYCIFFFVAYFNKGTLLYSLFISIVSFLLWYVFRQKIFLGSGLFFLGGFTFYLTLLISTHYSFLKWPVHLISIVAWLFVLVSYYYVDLNPSFWLSERAFKIASIAFPIFILFPFTICSLVLIETKIGPVFRYFSWVGDISYSSYLLQFPLQLLFAIAASYGILHPDFYISSSYLILYFLILISLSYIVYLKFERPAQKIIRGANIKKGNNITK